MTTDTCHTQAYSHVGRSFGCGSGGPAMCPRCLCPRGDFIEDLSPCHCGWKPQSFCAVHSVARVMILVLGFFLLGTPSLLAGERAPQQIEVRLHGVDDFIALAGTVTKAIGVEYGPVECRPITGPTDSSLGVALTARIAKAMAKVKRSGGDKPAYVAGSWTLTDSQSGFTPVLNLTVRDAQSNVKLVEIDAIVDPQPVAEAAAMLATTISLPDSSRQERTEALRERLKSPAAYVTDNSIVTAEPRDRGANVGVELLNIIEEKHTPIPMKVEAGQAIAPIAQDQCYAIRVNNFSDSEMAFDVRIDGFSVFEFSDLRDQNDKPRYQFFVVGPGQQVTIPGWHIHDDAKKGGNFAGFVTTELGSGASKVKPHRDTQSVGSITVVAHPTTPPGTRGLETGFGPPRTAQVEPVSRGIGPAVEVVAVRYTR